MSFRAVVEAVIHFESFRNIDLFHQGIYFLRTSLFYQRDESVPPSLNPYSNSTPSRTPSLTPSWPTQGE